jgi:hypothetical protein
MEKGLIFTVPVAIALQFALVSCNRGRNAPIETFAAKVIAGSR